MLDVVTFGEILWDVIDAEAHIGGAPFNLAAHAAQCGLNVATVSRIGDDALGHAALTEMARFGVSRCWTAVDHAQPTGTVTVTLREGQPSYTIRENVAWDFIEVSTDASRQLCDAHPRVFCFGTLAQRGAVSRATLDTLLESFHDTVTFYDVNLRQHYWSAPLVDASLARATIVKVNADEARVLGGQLFAGACTPEAFGAAVLERHPAHTVLVTLGADGCVVCERGRKATHCPSPRIDVADTVGAGDAFSAAFLAAWLQTATVHEAVAAGNARGAWVASQRGAVPTEQASERK